MHFSAKITPYPAESVIVNAGVNIWLRNQKKTSLRKAPSTQQFFKDFAPFLKVNFKKQIFQGFYPVKYI
jgi:hypothetical protein